MSYQETRSRQSFPFQQGLLSSQDSSFIINCLKVVASLTIANPFPVLSRADVPNYRVFFYTASH